MNEKEVAKELTKLLFVLKREISPTGNRKVGISHRDMMMLTGICEMGEEDMVKMSTISEFFHITPAAVSQGIRNFEREGWVERVVLEHDRRSVYVKVTEKARTIMKQCQSDMWKDLQEYIRFLGEEDSEALLRIMERSVTYFKHKRTDEKR